MTMRILRGILLICAFVFIIFPFIHVEAFAEGDGSIGDPYEIRTCAELSDMRLDLDASYELADNIDCSASGTIDPIGTSTAPFTGRFNGYRYTITGLQINSFESDVGLFGVTSGARIYAVNFTDAEITGTAGDIKIGVLVGHASNNTIIRGVEIDRSLVSTTGMGLTAGYLAGKVSDSKISNITIGKTTNYINIVGFMANIGGIAGYASGSIIDHFVSKGEFQIDFLPGSDTYIGGVVGYATGDISIEEGYVDATINPSNSSTYVGGIVGYIENGTPNISNTLVLSNEGTLTLDGSIVGRTTNISGEIFDNNWYYNLGSTPCAGDISVTCSEAFQPDDYYMPDAFMNQPTSDWDLGSDWDINMSSLPTLMDYYPPGGLSPYNLPPSLISSTIARINVYVPTVQDMDTFDHAGVEYSLSSDMSNSTSTSIVASDPDTYISILLTDLQCGATYYYQQFVTVGDSVIRAGISSFKTLCPTSDLTNYILNPGAQTGNMIHWNVLENGGNGWAIDTGGGHTSTSSFATSYNWDTRNQTIDLYQVGFTSTQLEDEGTTITFSEWIATRGDQGGKFYISVKLLGEDADINNPLATYATGTRASPITLPSGVNWFEQTYTFSNLPEGVRYVYVEDGGRDVSGWAGHYGTHFDDVSVTVALNPRKGCGSTVTYTGTEIITVSCGKTTVVPVAQSTQSTQSTSGSVVQSDLHNQSLASSTASSTAQVHPSATDTITTPSTSPATSTIPLMDNILKMKMLQLAENKRDLSLGARGMDVLELQRVLNLLGFTIATNGVGSKGQETEYFGVLTQKALARFQTYYSVRPAIGYFGPKTKAQFRLLAN